MAPVLGSSEHTMPEMVTYSTLEKSANCPVPDSWVTFEEKMFRGRICYVSGDLSGVFNRAVNRAGLGQKISPVIFGLDQPLIISGTQPSSNLCMCSPKECILPIYPKPSSNNCGEVCICLLTWLEKTLTNPFNPMNKYDTPIHQIIIVESK